MALSNYEAGRLWDLLEHAGELLAEVDAILEDKHVCRLCGKTTAVEDHTDDCIGSTLNEAYLRLTYVQQKVEQEFPDIDEEKPPAGGN